jgi:hypothetical protein
MTDAETGKQLVSRTYSYVENVSKESRKGLAADFNQNHKGVPFKSVPDILRKSTIDWFSRRDKLLKLTHESTTLGKQGEVRMTFQGETKRVQFKIHLNAFFAVTGQGDDSPSFLKEVNLSVDPREFHL